MAEIATYTIISIFMSVLLIIHVFGKSRGFGLFLGLIMMSTGVLVLMDGIEFKSGTFNQLNETAETLNVTYTYTDLKDTNPTQNLTIGIGGILFGLYAIINAFLGTFKTD